MTLVLAFLLAVLPLPQQSDVATLFDQGVSWGEFLDGAKAQRATWLANTGRASASDDLVARFREAAGDLKLLVVAEAACSDSVQTVPYLAKVAAAANIPMRIVNKAAGLSVLERHKTPDGRTATPTVILIRRVQDAGAWIERPAVLQAWFSAHGA